MLSCLADVTEKVRPPRWLDLPFPLGFPLGEPGRPDLQQQVLRAALDLLLEAGASPVRRAFGEPRAR